MYVFSTFTHVRYENIFSGLNQTNTSQFGTVENNLDYPLE